MKAEVYAAHSLLSFDGAEITANSIKCKYLGKEEKAHTILKAIKVRNSKMKTLVEKEEYAPGTLKKQSIITVN